MHKLVKQAFTLIELLVVIAIIGILSGLIIVSMGGVTDKATIAKAQVFSNSLRNSLMLNTIAEWKLNGNANDTWGSIPVGTINGATSTASDCIYDSCYSFNGTNSNNISFGDQSSLSFTNNIFTFSFWLKRTTAGDIGVLGKTNGTGSPYEYAVYSVGSTLAFYTWVTDGSSYVYNAITTTLDDNWNYFVWTADGINNYLYKNGVKGSLYAKTASSFSDTTSPFLIGRGCNAGTCRYLTGLLDEIRVYNTVVPTSQIKEQYYAGLNKLLANKEINAKEYQERLTELNSLSAYSK